MNLYLFVSVLINFYGSNITNQADFLGTVCVEYHENLYLQLVQCNLIHIPEITNLYLYLISKDAYNI